jgi:hypothetical protein
MIAWDTRKTAAEIAARQLADARADAAARIVAAVDACTLAITGLVPADEKLSWPTKEAAARAHIAGTADAAQTALLTGEATATGETLDALAAKIAANATVYRAAISTLTGLRRVGMAAVESASTQGEVWAARDAAVAAVAAALA